VKSSEKSGTPEEMPVYCDILAHTALTCAPDAFPALRRQPGPGPTLPANLLKHSDEQTVAALAAVREACSGYSLGNCAFDSWGIVAAPAFIGRSSVAASLQRYAIEGAWGVSPHVIPHRTQHSMSGTISQVLNLHGPNFGTGGGPSDAGQALLAAAVLMEREQLPGVWVVMTGWDPELIPDQDPPPATVCNAVAMALVAPSIGWRGLKLMVRPRLPAQEKTPVSGPPDFQVASFARFLREGENASHRRAWRLGFCGEVVFEFGAIAPVLPAPKSALRSVQPNRQGAKQNQPSRDMIW
jgi:hypothetical protein